MGRNICSIGPFMKNAGPPPWGMKMLGMGSETVLMEAA